MVVKREKGGVREEVSGRLTGRRAPLLEYTPPYTPLPTFDEECRSNPFRSFQRLRIKIVKEIEDMCGDLYPLYTRQPTSAMSS